ncbi:phospholipase domain-containing protein [Sphingomonas sp. RIT328]
MWPLAASDGWYDLTVTCTADAQALWRYAGKVETGRQGRTDPAIGTMRL